MIDLQNPRTWTDEDLNETVRLAAPIRSSLDGTPLGELVAKVDAELARRAEIKISRWSDVKYGPNPYGFGWDEIGEFHDASWYESRQTEAQWLSEQLGPDADSVEPLWPESPCDCGKGDYCPQYGSAFRR